MGELRDCYGDPATKSPFPLHFKRQPCELSTHKLKKQVLFRRFSSRTHDAKGLACSRRSGSGEWRDNESGGTGGMEGKRKRGRALSRLICGQADLFPFSFSSFHPKRRWR